MKLTLIALLTTIALPALADAPVFPGRDALPCDPDRFTPIYGADGETILYWNNPTCVYGGSDQPNPEDEDEEVVVEEPGDDTPVEDEPVEEIVAALD